MNNPKPIMRKIIKIDEEKCTGCGLCIIDCAEGSLKIVDGKARLVKDSYCDGLGACLGSCPEGALEIIEREADPFDEEAVEEYLKKEKEKKEQEQDPPPMACGCPSSMLRTFDEIKPADSQADDSDKAPVSTLTQWPVQLRLLPTDGQLYDNKNLMLIADCVAAAYPDLHRKLIKGNTIVMTCPKLDNMDESIAKLSEIFKNPLQSIGVAIMEVPCCSGLLHITRQALAKAGKAEDLKVIKIGIRGQVLEGNVS